MNYHHLGDHIQERLSGESIPDIWRFYCLLLPGANYGWGKENIINVDCSGTVCFPLWAAGYDIRTTADELYRRIFIHNVIGYHSENIQAVFYVADSDRKHGDRTVRKGTVVHVTPIVGQGVVVDATWGKEVRIRTLTSAIGEHKGYGTDPIIRAADWDVLESLSEGGKMAWGIDPVLNLLRG